MINRQMLTVPTPFSNYVAVNTENELLAALKVSTQRVSSLLASIPADKTTYAYAPGKWTIQQVLQHVIDAERVFVLRALWFARNDQSPLPGFDENEWAAHAPVQHRPWQDLVHEFNSLRTATEFFFASLNDEQLLYTGTANNTPLQAAAMGFVTAGHAIHHANVLQERYGV